MTLPTWLHDLLTSPKFWTLFIGLVQSIVFHYFTSFPQDLWVTIDAFLLGVVGIMFGIDNNNSKKAIKILQVEVAQAKDRVVKLEAIDPKSKK